MKIGQRQIGAEHPPYIIAEIGVNHDGSVARALELTRAAAAAGADAVKLQFFETDRLMSRAAKLAAYQKAAGETDPVAMLRRLELSIDDMARVVDLAHELKIHAIVTVFSVELVELAERLAWDAYKTASPDIVHRPLLEALAATGKPMVMSSGAATKDEIWRAISWISSRRFRSLAVLHCVSCYPTAPEDANIAAMGELFPVCGEATGYSDHTDAEDTGGLAVARGAAILEKHLTYSRGAAGPDHAASLAPDAFARYVALAHAQRWPNGTMRDPIREGSGGKRVLACEQDVRTVSRQSIVTTRELRAGDKILPEHITFKRPGTGLLPFRLEEILGKPLARDVETDVPLMEEDVRW